MRNPAPAPLRLLLNTPPLPDPSFPRCLAYEVALALCSCIAILVQMPRHNIRVTCYCLLFVGNELTKMVTMLLESTDSLGLGATRQMLDRLGWGLKAYMAYQLGLMGYQHGSLPIAIMAAHFLVANYKPARPDCTQSGRTRSFFKVMDFVNPVLVYSFLKQFDTQQPNLSILYLAFLCGNSLCSSEVRTILCHQESDMVGRSYRQMPNGKAELIWDRAHALKILMIGCSVALVAENFLLAFQALKKDVCLNILHTLINGVAVYVLSRQPGRAKILPRD